MKNAAHLVFVCIIVFQIFHIVTTVRNLFYYPESQSALIEALKANGDLRDDRVAEVMKRVDRSHYCSDCDTPYVDGPMPIGYGATISAPHMHVYVLQKLKRHLVAGARALDVGSGSGYLTVCMCLMVGPSGLAVGVEHMPQLYNQSVTNVLADHPLLYYSGNIKLIEGDGRRGSPDNGPYDAIHIGAATRKIPQALVDQLKPRGRLVAPVGPEGVQEMTIIDKKEEGTLVTTVDVSVRFIPLTDKWRQQMNNF